MEEHPSYRNTMTKERLAIIGAGDFAREIIPIAEDMGIGIAGFFCPDSSISDSIVFNESEVNYSDYKEYYDSLFIGLGVGTGRDIKKRQKIISFFEDRSVEFATLIANSVKLYDKKLIGEGTFLAHNVVVSIGAEIGKHNIINTSTVIGHDVKTGSNTCISPLSFIGGNVEIGDNVLIGGGCSIMQGVKIGSNSVIGIGNSIFSDVPSSTLIMPKI